MPWAEQSQPFGLKNVGSIAEGFQMAKVDPRHLKVIRQLTDLPISACRDALIDAGGDIGVVIRQLRESARRVFYASDAEVSAVMASNGLVYVPHVYQPVMLSDSEVVAELTASGQAASDFILIGGLVCRINADGGLVVRRITDPDLAASTMAYLRRLGVPEYPSMNEYLDRR